MSVSQPVVFSRLFRGPNGKDIRATFSLDVTKLEFLNTTNAPGPSILDQLKTPAGMAAVGVTAVAVLANKRRFKL